MKTNRILVVDDEETLCDIIKFNLEIEGYDVDTALSAEQALRLNLKQYSLILLDIMMGETSGLKFAKFIRNNPETAHIAIIFCTAKSNEDDMVMGLNIGGDDYITKPFTMRNLIARVKSVLRRTITILPEQQPHNTYTLGNLFIDHNLKKCTIGGEEIRLARKEFQLLSFLTSHPNTIHSREEILSNIWSDEVVVLDRTIDVNITRLRHKLGQYGNHIITRSGYGYGFEE